LLAGDQKRLGRRSPVGGIMERVSRLESASSPYLLQHRGNPVDRWE
jgi:hypothetical protein